MKALIVVDIQNDFLPGGALGVPRGDEVIAVANRLMALFPVVVATQDWHPANHGSFASQHPGHRPGDVIDLAGRPQILWPDHCIRHTPGAEFAPGLDRTSFAAVFHKGTDPSIDSYSCFFDNAHLKSTGLGEWLRQRRIDDICLMGLATDYCVRFSALDAVSLGLHTSIFLPGCRGVELHPGDCDRAIADLRAAGVQVLTDLAELTAPVPTT